MKIMFVMLRTLGDVIVGTTLCRELKRDYPESEIHFFTNSAYADLIRNNPFIDRVRESSEWVIDMLFLEFSRGNYDRSYFPYQIRRECNSWHQFEGTRHQHLVDFYWKRMGKVRPISERECYLFPTESDFEKSKRHISMDVPRVAVHSTSGVATKDWPYFEDLVEQLRQMGYGVAQVGARTDKVVRGTVDLRGRMGLLELAAFLAQCTAFVGLDSGVSYIADAMKIPTVVIQGSTNPVTSGPISDRVIHLFASETGYNDCQEVRCHSNCRQPVNCNTTIRVEQVIEKLKPILEGKALIVPAGV